MVLLGYSRTLVHDPQEHVAIGIADRDVDSRAGATVADGVFDQIKHQPIEERITSDCQSVSGAIEYIKKTVGDEAIVLTDMHSMEPSPISRTDCEGWQRVSRAVADTWKGAVVAPYLMVQCSDSRHYGAISDRVYRFSAMDLTAEERRTIHGNNERITLEAIGKAVEFFMRLMKQC